MITKRTTKKKYRKLQKINWSHVLNVTDAQE